MTKRTLTYQLQQLAAWAVAAVVGAFRHYGVSAIRAQKPSTINLSFHDFEIIAFNAVGASDGVGIPN
jgi:hypothetical protein